MLVRLHDTLSEVILFNAYLQKVSNKALFLIKAHALHALT
jgi:hypothetical protein